MPFLSCLTQSPILHQDSKNTHAVAYLCFLLLHFIIVPIVSPVLDSCNFSQLIMQSLKWQPQTHLLSSWLQRIHKTVSQERLYLEGKQLQLSFIITYYILVSKRINNGSLHISQSLWEALKGFHIGCRSGNDFTAPTFESKIMWEPQDLHLELLMKGIRTSPFKAHKEKRGRITQEEPGVCCSKY